MEKLEDIVLKQGDIVTLENGEIFNIWNSDGFNLWNSAGKSLKDYNSTHYNNKIIEVKRTLQYETIYKRPQEILDKEEKEYLSAVIRPFKNKVQKITKMTSCNTDFQYLEIIYYEDFFCQNDEILLPTFKGGTMYKGMKTNRGYTLEELGL